MSCRYYLFPINNIYASVLYACYLFSRQIIYLFFLLWAYSNVIDSCCREIIRLRGNTIQRVKRLKIHNHSNKTINFTFFSKKGVVQ